MINKDESIELNKLFEICHENLLKSKEHLSYLENRHVTSESIKKYKLGYFPQNISILKKYIKEEVLQKLNILNLSGSSQFSEYFSLIFPIYSEYKEPLAIGGRTLLSTKERNYLNLPKYINSTFKKANYMFGLQQSRSYILKNKNVYVVEGYFDQIALDKNGIFNSVAICGTAFSKNHFLKLSRYTDEITFILDRDDAGIKSMERIYAKYNNQGIKLRLMLLPKNCKDVDDYFEAGGKKEVFLSGLEHYIPNW